MNFCHVNIDLAEYPQEIHGFFEGGRVFDYSGHSGAAVLFSDKEDGYFVKTAPKGTLKREAAMTRYFYGLGLSAKVEAYISAERDFFVTRKIKGENCTAPRYLNEPERLCDVLAERLIRLHSIDFKGCPNVNRTEYSLSLAEENFKRGSYDKTHFPDNWGYRTADEAWRAIEENGHLLKADVLTHGDYCLPNVILNDWEFSGFVDLGDGGAGDRHFDVFWAVWSLNYNLKFSPFNKLPLKERLASRFFDAYGRDKIDQEMLKLVAAVELFG